MMVKLVKDEMAQTQTQLARPFVQESSLSSAWGQHYPTWAQSSLHDWIAATKLGGGEVRERVDDIEPWRLLVRMKGMGRLAYW